MSTLQPLRKERVLTCNEVKKIVNHHERCWRLRQYNRYVQNRRTNYTIFRLSLLGLRASEISGLNLGDVVTFGERPCIRVRKETTKGISMRVKGERVTMRFGRTVPLWWDPATLEDIKWYVQFRREQIEAQKRAGVLTVTDFKLVKVVRESWSDLVPQTYPRALGDWKNEPLVCAQSNDNRRYTVGNRLTRNALANRWQSCIRRALGPERTGQLSIHCGRHTFASHAIRTNRPLTQVRDAAGWRSLDMMSVYAHALEDEKHEDLYGFVASPIYMVEGGPTRVVSAIRIPDPLFMRLHDWATQENIEISAAVEYAIRSLVNPINFDANEKQIAKLSSSLKLIETTPGRS